MKFTKSLVTLALISSAALGLTACGGSTSEAKPTAPNVEAINGTPAAAAPAATATEAPKSERGNLIKKLKEPAGMSSSTGTGKQIVNFTIDSIKVDAPCTGAYPQPATNGHLAVVAITAQTTPELGKEAYKKFDVSASSFKFIAANGTTFNGNLGSMGSYSCLPDDQEFPMGGMGPAEKVTAKVVLDVPAAHGTLVFTPPFVEAGWEYKF